MRHLLAALLMCFIPYLSALTQSFPGEFAMDAEWLFMTPLYDHAYFVIDSAPPSRAEPESDNPPRGRRIANNQNWHSGYRIEMAYSFCNDSNEIKARWTHFPTFSEQKCVSGEHLFGVIGDTRFRFRNTEAIVDFHDTFDFYYLDLLVGQKLVDCPSFSMDVQLGLQLGYLDLREQMVVVPSLPHEFSSALSSVNFHSQLFGVGPKVGYELSLCLNHMFTLKSQGGIALLMCERTSSTQSNNGDFSFNPPTITTAINDETYWSKIASADLRFGLNYTKPLNFRTHSWIGCFCRFTQLSLEGGYEVVTYLDGLQRIIVPSSASISFDQYFDFTLHGPYMHLGLRF